jgi:hypothetical protein
MVVLSILLGITMFCLLAAIARIRKIQQLLEMLDKEQHIQNRDIIDLLRYRQESSVMLLQHSKILQYLVEQDPLLDRIKNPMGGVVGQA